MSPDERKDRVAFLTDWCRRDPDMGAKQLEREEPDVAKEVRERVANGPQAAVAVWEALRVMREQAKGRKK